MKKTRKKLRKEIAESANRLRSDIYLGMVLQVSELFRKSFDEKEYAELSDLQLGQRMLVIEILGMKDERDVSLIHSVVAGMRQGKENLQNKQRKKSVQSRSAKQTKGVK